MKYGEAIEYLSELSRFGSRLRLDATLELLDFLGNPPKAYKTIHVAGTNGKGSVCAMLKSILAHSGLKTGMYVSPPLKDFNERVMVDGKFIDEKDVARLTKVLMPKVDEMAKRGSPPTQFEVVTATAFKHFEERKVDVAVIETGLGGRLDATNVITPVISIITNVQKDHTEILGKNLSDIAREKAGIIKDSVPVVTAETEESALGVIRTVCREKNSKLTVVGRDVNFEPRKSGINGQIFDYHGLKDYEGLEIKLIGGFQIKNASTVLAAAELLPFDIKENSIRAGLKEARWPGRMELIDAGKKVLLDCAHNPAGARELARTIEELFVGNAVFVMGISAGKDLKGILEELSRVGSKFIITKSTNSNAEKAERIAEEVKRITDDYMIKETVSDALSHALSIPNESLICVTGSIFVVGEARAMLKTED